MSSKYGLKFVQNFVQNLKKITSTTHADVEGSK